MSNIFTDEQKIKTKINSQDVKSETIYQCPGEFSKTDFKSTSQVKHLVDTMPIRRNQNEYRFNFTEKEFNKLCQEHTNKLIHRSLKSIDKAYLGLRMHGISREDNMWYVFDKYLTDDDKRDFDKTIAKTKKKFEDAARERKRLEAMQASNEPTDKELYEAKMAAKPSFKQWCVSKGIHPEDPTGMHRHVGQETWEDYINEVDPKGYNEQKIPGVNFFPY